MSGHSKWHNIRVKKMATDAKRGKIYTRHARLIEIAARAGGGDPDTNAALRTAIENAKAENVPNANIERAIKKGSGELRGEAMAEMIYGAMAPGGGALLIECLTDNKNRTINSIRTICGKNGATWTDVASILWMFDRVAVVTGDRNTPLTEEDELACIDAGADHIDATETGISVRGQADTVGSLRDALTAQGYRVREAGLKYMPKQTVVLADADTARSFLRCMDAIEEDDDVSEVHTNVDIAADIAETLS